MATELNDFTLVGAGSLGAVLGRSLVKLGMRLDQVVVRNRSSGQRLVDEIGYGEVVEIQNWKGTDSNLVILSISDDQLEKVSFKISGHGDWQGKTVLHTSGVHNKNVLDALAQKGAFIGSFHPLQTFLGTEDGSSFRGITIGIEGDPMGVEHARHLANGLLAEPVEILSENKSLYHASAVMAGNAAITLMSVSEEMWEKAAGAGSGFKEAMGPLIRTSIQNALTKSQYIALTGPIVRGDVGTLREHFEAIAKRLPHLLTLYGSIATESVHLAVRSGRLPADQAVALLDTISDHIVRDATSE
jgi:predicted short-subunit dehydrogenase-like oxidoreductase (DUF2520 family)